MTVPKLVVSWGRFILAGAFVAYYAAMVYSELYQPRRVGIELDFKDGKMLIAAVIGKSPASRSGLMPGDRLVAVDQREILHWEDWRRFLGTREIGRTYRFELERAGQRLEKPVTLGRQPGDPWARLEKKRFVQFFLLLFALVLGFRRPEEEVAQIGAWLLAGLGTAPIFPDAEMTAVWGNLPSLLAIVLWIPQITHVMLLPLFFSFFAIFPLRIFRARWPWLIVWAPAALVGAYWFPNFYRYIYRPEIVAEVPAWLLFVVGCAILIYMGGALAALILNYRRATDMKDRRRMRVLVVGAVIGLLPGLPFLAAIFLAPLTESSVVWFFVSTPYRLFSLGLFLAFPLSLAYALVRHRLLDLTSGNLR